MTNIETITLYDKEGVDINKLYQNIWGTPIIWSLNNHCMCDKDECNGVNEIVISLNFKSELSEYDIIEINNSNGIIYNICDIGLTTVT